MKEFGSQLSPEYHSTKIIMRSSKAYNIKTVISESLPSYPADAYEVQILPSWKGRFARL